MEPIINSVLDTDLYKLTMQQAIFHQYPDAEVKYEFRCRDEGVQLGYLADYIREQVEQMQYLRLTPEEMNYLESLNLFSDDYLDFLAAPEPFDVMGVDVENRGGELNLTIGGEWKDAVLWETPLLAIISELYFRDIYSTHPHLAKGMETLFSKQNKLREYPDVSIAEFGTRRRISRNWHHNYIGQFLFGDTAAKPFLTPHGLNTTSNVQLAMEHNLQPAGTMAHEWIMAHLGLVDRTQEAQKRSLHVWQQEYGHKLSTALTDTFTTDVFLKDFDQLLSETYAAVRQDSGNPYEFTEKMLKHWKEKGIDPLEKTILYSDNLTVNKAVRLWETYGDEVNVNFGIGTHLTNDIPGITPLNIVIKMTECNGVSCMKLSDDPGKATQIGSKDTELQKQKLGLI